MLMCKLKVVTAVLLAIALLSSGAASLTQSAAGGLGEKPAAKPAKGKPSAGESDATATSGVVKAVDVAANTITMANKFGESVFTVAKDANIVLDGKAAKLSDLRAGMSVALHMAQKTVNSIQADWPLVSGAAKAVDADRSTITLFGAKLGEHTFAVAKDTTVVIDGRPGKLADVPVQAQVVVKLSADKSTARSIEVVAQQIPGVVTAVDTVKHTITVANKLGQHTFDIAKNASVYIDGKPGRLADLPVEAQVILSLGVAQKTVRTIQTEGPPVAGIVKAVDAAANAVSLADKRGERTINLAKDARVLIDNDKEGKLTDLIDGTIISGRLSTGKQEIIGILRAAGPTFQGVVKAVDAEKNTITLTIASKTGGEDRTFSITKDTKIVTAIYGLALPVSDLKQAREVILRLSIDQKAAARITLLGL